MITRILITQDCSASLDGINILEFEEGSEIDASEKLLNILTEDQYVINVLDEDINSADADETKLPGLPE